jgi:hypothetical protein
VYRSWVAKYWRKAGLDNFNALIRAVMCADEAVMAFNDNVYAEEKIKSLGKAYKELRNAAEMFLQEP